MSQNEAWCGKVGLGGVRSGLAWYGFSIGRFKYSERQYVGVVDMETTRERLDEMTRVVPTAKIEQKLTVELILVLDRIANSLERIENNGLGNHELKGRNCF